VTLCLQNGSGWIDPDSASVDADDLGLLSMCVSVRNTDDVVIVCEEAGGTFGVVTLGQDAVELATRLSAPALLEWFRSHL
jgi:hypothetical protein